MLAQADFDKHQCLAFSHDQIDFAVTRAYVLLYNGQALRAQMAFGLLFALSSAAQMGSQFFEHDEKPMPGILYIVATPIGNLADMSRRGKDSLQQADVIACEDTRHSRHLLDAIGVDKPLLALHRHNERGSAHRLLDRLLGGANVAVICDAGTPGVSDPGALLVELALANDIRVVPIPGPCAAITALSASGFSSARFYFAGFIPPKIVARRAFLSAAGKRDCVTIFYEAPHRIGETLAAMAALYDKDRVLVIARELSKTFEQIVRLPIGEAPRWLAADAHHGKGEFVLLLEGEPESSAVEDWREMARELTAAGVSHRDTAALVAKYSGAKKKQVYRFLIA